MDKKLKVFLVFEALFCFVAFLFIRNSTLQYNEVIAFPFVQVGVLIRALSLSGVFGNVVAWVIYVFISSLPIIYLLTRIKSRTYKAVDTLMVLLCGLLYFGLYFMINPSFAVGLLAPKIIGNLWKLSVASVVYILLISYFIIRLLQVVKSNGTDKLLNNLELLLSILAVVFVVLLCLISPIEITNQITVLKTSHATSSIDLSITNLFIVLKKLNNMIPVFYQLLIACYGLALIKALKINFYSQQVVDRANQLAQKCQQAVTVTVIYSLIFNILQLIAGASLLSSSYQFKIPLISMILVIIVMLFSKYFANSVQIKREMDLFV